MELVPGAYTEVLATIDAFDFGAYGVLEVTATTEDGQQLIGHLEGQEDKTELVIPKHAENSFIADNWKEAYGAAAEQRRRRRRRRARRQRQERRLPHGVRGVPRRLRGDRPRGARRHPARPH